MPDMNLFIERKEKKEKKNTHTHTHDDVEHTAKCSFGAEVPQLMGATPPFYLLE